MKQVTVEIAPKLAFLFKPKRYKCAYGGRGGAKSWGYARALIVLCCQKKLRVLCAREVQKSIKDSVYQLLLDQIEALGLGSKFTATKNEIKGPNGSQFLFAGLADHTIESVKSFEGIDIVWVEEAQTVSKRSWSILIPTIRKDGSEIWITMNPNEETDPTYQEFIKTPPEDAVVVKINWDDNPWFPDVLRKEKDRLYASDPEAAEHIWGGACRKVTDAQILRGRYRVQHFEAVPGVWDGPYFGIDFGFAKDMGTMVKMWIWEGDLYLEYEAAGLEVETDLLPSLWDTIPGARDHIARADCARPETISQVKRLGYKRVVQCRKWTGCEKDGIEFLRSFQSIIIHPRCSLATEEARLWSWKTDRLTGDILPETTGKHDNTWAAARYGLEPLITARKRIEFVEEQDEYAGYRGRGTTWMA